MKLIQGLNSAAATSTSSKSIRKSRKKNMKAVVDDAKSKWWSCGGNIVSWTLDVAAASSTGTIVAI